MVTGLRIVSVPYFAQVAVTLYLRDLPRYLARYVKLKALDILKDSRSARIQSPEPTERSVIE